MAETDDELLAWSATGDASAFRELYGRHSQAVHAYLARRAGRSDADDLLSEVWLRAFRARHGYITVGYGVRPWLFGIARNVLLEHRRLCARRQPIPYVIQVIDPWPDVDARLDAEEFVSSLHDALATIAEGELEVLLLVVWEQLTPAEAAVVLGIPQGTARSRLHRALGAIRCPSGDHPALLSCSDPKEV